MAIEEAVTREAGLALDLIGRLSSGIGPRRPCSEAEAQAAQLAIDWLAEHGVKADVEPFRGYASFAHPYGLILGASLVGTLLQKRRRRTGNALTLGALTAFALEGDLRVTPISDLVARATSANVIASVAPAGEERQCVCVAGHLDSTRSGPMFHPQVVPHLRVLFQIPAVAAAIAVYALASPSFTTQFADILDKWGYSNRVLRYELYDKEGELTFTSGLAGLKLDDELATLLAFPAIDAPSVALYQNQVGEYAVQLRVAHASARAQR